MCWQTRRVFLYGHKLKGEPGTCLRPTLCFSCASLVFPRCCVHRFQPAGLVERIQAIAQNVSNMAIRVEQILQNSAVQGRGTAASASSVHVVGVGVKMSAREILLRRCLFKIPLFFHIKAKNVRQKAKKKKTDVDVSEILNTRQIVNWSHCNLRVSSEHLDRQETATIFQQREPE